jgi:transposase
MGRFISHQDRKSGTTGSATIIARSARQHKRISRYLGVYLRRQRSRLRTPNAITAAAHKLARTVYNLMRYGLAYVEQTEAAYAAQVRERQERQLQRRARELGFEVKKVEAAAVE